jgi:hypothetical protein
METSRRWNPGCVLLALALGIGSAGCGKSKDGSDAQTDPMAGINSPASTGGNGASTQIGGSGTQTGAGTPTGAVNLDALPKCPKCERAHCVPANLVPAAQQALLDRCQDQGSFCVPDVFLQSPNDFVLPTCRSLADAEGRCASTCLPLVATEISRLPQDSCKSDERCVPCFHPVTGEDTQVCRQGADPGPQQPATSFPKCCQTGGVCVPTTLVPQDFRSFLERAECPSADQLCAPQDLTRADVKPDKCKSINDANGRCLSTCIPALASLTSILPKSSCPDQYLCVPCADPLTNTDTGACRINGDSPTF